MVLHNLINFLTARTFILTATLKIKTIITCSFCILLMERGNFIIFWSYWPVPIIIHLWLCKGHAVGFVGTCKALLWKWATKGKLFQWFKLKLHVNQEAQLSLISSSLWTRVIHVVHYHCLMCSKFFKCRSRSHDPNLSYQQKDLSQRTDTCTINRFLGGQKMTFPFLDFSRLFVCPL